jgi:probable F420-dependent oxidoreductase
VRIGVVQIFDGTPGRGREHIEEYAIQLERLGFASLWVPDHVIFFDAYDSAYPHTDDGTIDFKTDQGILEPVMALQAAAMVTENLGLGTSVEIITERNPVTRAREIATLDRLSGGRFEYGIGIGWSREEYAALGIPFEARGKRCDEYVEAMRALWSQHRATYHGEFVDFTDVVFFPKTHRQPGPRIQIGGNSDAALRRVARLGDGWHGWKLTPDELDERLARLHELLQEHDRDRDELKLNVGIPHNGSPDELAAYADHCRRAGIDELVLALPISRRTFKEQLETYARALGVGANA